MERRERPILDVGNETVLDGIVPAIVDVVSIVTLVADQMLPIASLPDATLAACLPAPGAPFAGRDGLRKPNLDEAPAER